MRKPSFWIATAALFVALGGTAIAGSHYLITSTRQIKPSVLRHLRGTRGPAGPEGAEGPIGPNGIQGRPGASANLKPLERNMQTLEATVKTLEEQVSHICLGIALAEIQVTGVSNPEWFQTEMKAILEKIRPQGCI